MSLVSRPCRYVARSAPDTTIRPRSDRSMNAARCRAASYAVRRNIRNHGAMLRHALASILSARRCTALVIAVPLAAAAQQPPAPAAAPGSRRANFTIFLRGVPIGTEQIAVDARRRAAGRSSAPAASARRSTSSRGASQVQLHAGLEAARVHVRRHRARTGADVPHDRRTARRARSDIIDRRPDDAEDRHRSIANALLVLPNSFFGPYEALAERLKTAARRQRAFRSTASPQFSFTIARRRIDHRADPDHRAPDRRAAHARRRSMLPGAPLDAEIWADDSGRLLRVQRAGADRSTSCARTSRRCRRAASPSRGRTTSR